MNIRPFREIKRRKTKEINVGHVKVGGDNPISVQSILKMASLKYLIFARLERIIVLPVLKILYQELLEVLLQLRQLRYKKQLKKG